MFLSINRAGAARRTPRQPTQAAYAASCGESNHSPPLPPGRARESGRRKTPAEAAVIFVLALIFVSYQTFPQEKKEAASVIYAKSLVLRGEPVYKEGFTHFNYVNPNAPKGGDITLYSLGTFDNFNRYALRGNCSAGSEYFYDTLMKGSDDETDALHPLIAESVEYASDYSYIIFNINPDAKDQEGEKIDAEDAAFSFQVIFEHGVPQFKAYYSNVTATVLSKSRVRFDLKGGGDKEKMLSVASFTIFPKRFWQDENGVMLHDFSQPLSTPPVGTGPYRITDYRMGQYVKLSRIKDYWAADLPVNKGLFNFDSIRYDYYRDANVAFEAFKAGEYDFREENSASNWALGYTGAAFKNGAIVREEQPNQIAQPMQGFVFNTQRPIFSDRRVRRALNYFLDFNWMNKNLFYGQYKRTRSYFQNTEYEASGLPSASELRELEVLRGKAPDEVFTSEYNPPETDGGGYIRDQARLALKFFSQAGWNLKNGRLVNEKGEPFIFELLIYDVSSERIAVPLRRNMEKFGITMNIRLVDTSQFINRLRSRDFDMISSAAPAMPYPSSDVLILWHSKYIDSTWNTAGVSDEAVDYLCEQIALSQEDGERLLALGRALDRVLTWNFYAIPQWHIAKFRIAYKNKFEKPAAPPRYAIGRDSWWIKPGG
ncbi:MAG: extracellular solute-binding protein [Spirochaetaceae bacterium]|jgi:microcin C transport system substrate-binding protein|nr:extracellular solute-binding protein [Spirochaetaceae bacterium]